MPDIDRILSAFSVDRVYVPGVTWRYRVGLLFVTFGMFLLPVLYVALVIGAGFLLKTWAIVGMALFEGVRLNFIFFFLYLATLIPLCILLVFMVRPLFNRRPKVEEAFVLDSPSQPGLREFVLTLCAILGARSPHKIYLTNVVNAGASLEPGIMGMFLRRYNLIIGLPLVNGLSMQSFAGVLAHELGHFSQHTGMRLTHIIEVINDWFARIVMLRDSLDEKITAHRQSDDWRREFVAWISEGLLKLVRAILRQLMKLGLLISRYALRQMEFHADACQALVEGSGNFAATTKSISTLGFVQASSEHMLRYYGTEGMLVNNLAAFLDDRAQYLNDEWAKVFEKTHLQQVNNFSTHPSNPERIAAVEKQTTPGIFHLTDPARNLFDNFNELSKQVTLYEYRARFGADIEQKAQIVDVEKFVEENKSVAKATEICDAFLGVQPYISDAIVFSWSDVAHSEPRLVDAAAEYARAKEKLQSAIPAAQVLDKERSEHYDRYINHRGALTLAELSLPFDAKSWNVASTAEETLQDEVDAEKNNLDRLLVQLKEYKNVARDALILGLRARLKTGPIEEMERLVNAHEQMLSIASHFLAMRERYYAISPIVAYPMDGSLIAGKVMGLAQEMFNELGKVLEGTAKIPYPFSHQWKPEHVAQYLNRLPPKEQFQPIEVYESCEMMMMSFGFLHVRVLGGIISLIEPDRAKPNKGTAASVIADDQQQKVTV